MAGVVPGAVRHWAAQVFACDYRALAVWRMALGVLLLLGLAFRLPEFSVFFTESGTWPIAAARADGASAWSLYLLHNSPAYAGGLLAFSALAAVALILGWRTRWVTALSWLLLVSLQSRNELILNGGDLLLRLLLFWALFLPLGACWSLDARRRGVHLRGPVASAATAVLLLQVLLVYFFNALYKTGDAWLAKGTAIEEVLRLETYVTPLGHWLLGWPDVLRVSTRFVWWLELLGPLLMLVPWRMGLTRTVLVLAFMGFHVALWATIRIGLFPLIGVAAWIPFLPIWRWGRSESILVAEEHISPPRRWLGTRALAVALLAFWAMLVTLMIFRLLGKTEPTWIRNLAVATRTDQRWQLFAPFPLRSEGWYLVVVEASDGRDYDARTGGEVDWSRPASLAANYESVNWRKFVSEIRDPKKPQRARWLAQWYAQRWQQAHPALTVQRVRMHYLWEYTQRRQRPPDHFLVYEEPPGALTEQAKKLGQRIADPGGSVDN